MTNRERGMDEAKREEYHRLHERLDDEGWNCPGTSRGPESLSLVCTKGGETITGSGANHVEAARAVWHQTESGLRELLRRGGWRCPHKTTLSTGVRVDCVRMTASPAPLDQTSEGAGIPTLSGFGTNERLALADALFKAGTS